MDLLPSEHQTQEPCLRLRNLPVNAMADTMLVVKLEFVAPLAGDEASEVERTVVEQT